MTTSVSFYPSSSLSVPANPPAGPGTAIIRAVIPVADIKAAISAYGPAHSTYITVPFASILQQNVGFTPQSFSIENRNAFDFAVYVNNGVWTEMHKCRSGERIYKAINNAQGASLTISVWPQVDGFVQSNSAPDNGWQDLAVSDIPINIYNFPQRDRMEDLWQIYTPMHRIFYQGISDGAITILNNNLSADNGIYPLLRLSGIEASWVVTNTSNNAWAEVDLILPVCVGPPSGTNPTVVMFPVANSSVYDNNGSYSISKKKLLENFMPIVLSGRQVYLYITGASASIGAIAISASFDILWPVQEDANF